MGKIPPSILFPGITVTPTGLNIPFSALEGLDRADADPANGNAIALLFALAKTINQRYNDLAPDAKTGAFVCSQTHLTAANGRLSQSFCQHFSFNPPANLTIATDI